MYQSDPQIADYSDLLAYEKAEAIRNMKKATDQLMSWLGNYSTEDLV